MSPVRGGLSLFFTTELVTSHGDLRETFSEFITSTAHTPMGLELSMENFLEFRFYDLSLSRSTSYVLEGNRLIHNVVCSC